MDIFESYYYGQTIIMPSTTSLVLQLISPFGLPEPLLVTYKDLSMRDGKQRHCSPRSDLLLFYRELTFSNQISCILLKTGLEVLVYLSHSK